MICPVASLPTTCLCTPERREACADEMNERSAIMEFCGGMTRAEAERDAGARQVLIGFARQPGQRTLI
jgi:hypothetical protein